jgi:hypothetical protein
MDDGTLDCLTWDDLGWLAEMGWMHPRSRHCQKEVGCAWLCFCGWIGTQRDQPHADAELDRHQRKAHAS